MNKTRRNVALALVVFALASVSQAAELVVHSVAGEPLNATIVMDGDPRGLSLAPPQAYTERGLAFTSVHEDAELGLTSSSGKTHITLTTRSPVNEPAFHILVTGAAETDYVEFGVLMEVAAAAPAPLPRYQPTVNGEIPVAGGQQLGGALDAGTTPINPEAARYSSGTVRGGISSNSALTPTANVSPAPQNGWQYGPVQRGDSLWRIATNALGIVGGNVNSAMRAIASANPQAFINGDMNRLRVGVILSLGELTTPPNSSVLVAVGPTPPAATNPGVPLDASVNPQTTPGTRAAPAQSTRTPLAMPAASRLEVASVSTEALASIGAGIDALSSVGKQVAAARAEISQKLNNRRAKLEAVRARLAAQNEQMAALTARVAQLSSAIGIASLKPIAAPSTPAPQPDLTVPASVPAAAAGASMPAGSSTVSQSSTASAVGNSSKATTNKSLNTKQPESSLPSRPVSPQSTIDWVQTLVTEYGLLIGGGLLLLSLIVLAVTSVKNLLSKRRARVGDTKRDEDLKAKVRAKTEAAAVTDGLLDIASFDDAETIDTLPASKRGAEVQTKATRVNVRDLPLEVGPDLNPSSPVDEDSPVEFSNVIPFARRSATNGAMYDLGIATDSGDGEDTLQKRS